MFAADPNRKFQMLYPAPGKRICRHDLTPYLHRVRLNFIGRPLGPEFNSEIGVAFCSLQKSDFTV
jgi:hypothetical protein